MSKYIFIKKCRNQEDISSTFNFVILYDTSPLFFFLSFVVKYLHLPVLVIVRILITVNIIKKCNLLGIPPQNWLHSSVSKT